MSRRVNELTPSAFDEIVLRTVRAVVDDDQSVEAKVSPQSSKIENVCLHVR